MDIDEATAAIIEIIVAPVAIGTANRVFAEREKELWHLIKRLSAATAFALKSRLRIGKADDPLVLAWNRLTLDRRDRLMDFLDDPGRAVRTYDGR